MAHAFEQAKPIQRCGILLKEIEPQQGANQNIRDGTVPKVTRGSAAENAGLAERQHKTALRVPSSIRFDVTVQCSHDPDPREQKDRPKALCVTF